MAHRGSPIAYERSRRGTESPTQSRYWYLRPDQTLHGCRARARSVALFPFARQKEKLTAKYFLLESLHLSLLLNNRDVLAIRAVEGDACEKEPTFTCRAPLFIRYHFSRPSLGVFLMCLVGMNKLRKRANPREERDIDSPAESYPRYSNLFRPPTSSSKISFLLFGVR